MDIHKPKAAHSWREFLIEIGTIICGILIALSLEQAVEAWHWRERVDQAQEAMRHEFADDDGPQAYARAAVASCMSQRLDAMESAIRARQPEARIAALADDYHPFALTWDAESWKAATASGVLSHFDKASFDGWFPVFVAISWFERDQAVEHDLVDVLRNGLHGAAPLTDDQADRAIRAVQGLRRTNHDNALRAQYVLMRGSELEARVQNASLILDDLRKVYGGCVSRPPEIENPSSAYVTLY